MKTALGWLVFLGILYALAYGVFGVDWAIFGSEVTAYKVRCCKQAPSDRTEKVHLSADETKQLVARLLRENPSASREQIVALARAERQKPVIAFDLAQLQRRSFKVYPSEQKVVFWTRVARSGRSRAVRLGTATTGRATPASGRPGASWTATTSTRLQQRTCITSRGSSGGSSS